MDQKIYRPQTGQIVMCDFSTGFQPPEIVKRRPVVVVSNGKVHLSQLATVIPISTAEPDRILPWHVETTDYFQLGRERIRHWAKCDLINTVSFHRLDRPHHRDHGRRVYETIVIPDELLATILEAHQQTTG